MTTFIVYDDGGIIFSGDNEEEATDVWSALGTEEEPDGLENATWSGDLVLAQVLKVRN